MSVVSKTVEQTTEGMKDVTRKYGAEYLKGTEQTALGIASKFNGGGGLTGVLLGGSPTDVLNNLTGAATAGIMGAMGNAVNGAVGAATSAATGAISAATNAASAATGALGGVTGAAGKAMDKLSQLQSGEAAVKQQLEQKKEEALAKKKKSALASATEGLGTVALGVVAQKSPVASLAIGGVGVMITNYRARGKAKKVQAASKTTTVTSTNR